MTPSKKRHVYQQKHQPQPKQQKAVPMRKSRKKLWIALALLAILFISIGGYYMIVQGQNQSQNQVPTATPTPTPAASTSPTPSSSTQGTKVLLHTSMGDITLQLRDDKPITTASFINLVKQGKYDGTIFHRIMVGFMIQGGVINQNLPTIKDEIGTYNRNLPYTIAMAKTSDPNSATSSFFINVADNGNNPIDAAGTKFDAVYTAFGTVISGKSVVDAIANVPVTTNPYGENSQPLQTVTLIKASIVS